MNFDLSEEQRLLRDNVERLLAKTYDFETRRKIAAGPEGFSRAAWARYADMGLLGLPFAEEDGGFGGGPVETMLVMECFGRALPLEPYFATAILSGALLRRAAAAELRATLVPLIGEGKLLLAFAHYEAQSRYLLHSIATTARREGDAYRIDGEKCLVLGGAEADKFLISARLSGATHSRDGIGLFLVDSSTPGLSRRSYRTQDGERAAALSFAALSVPASALICDDAAGAIDAAFDEALAALCAEAVGAMDEALKLTVDYLKTRVQFRVPLGSFQALQHRAADIYVALEQARSMTLFAVMGLSESDPHRRRTAALAAKARINESALFVGEQAVQLHGGIGMTMEYKLGHLFKRLTTIRRLFADTDHCLDQLAESESLLAAP